MRGPRTTLEGWLADLRDRPASDEHESCSIGRAKIDGQWIAVDVTSSVKKWLAKPSDNNGWVIAGASEISGSGNDNDVHYHSSE